MHLRPACCIVLMLPAFFVGGCSDTINAEAPPSARTLARDYDRTLTPAEKSQAISELRAKTQQKDANAAAEAAEGQD
jgi:hypothetical protein